MSLNISDSNPLLSELREFRRHIENTMKTTDPEKKELLKIASKAKELLEKMHKDKNNFKSYYDTVVSIRKITQLESLSVTNKQKIEIFINELPKFNQDLNTKKVYKNRK